MTALLYRWPEAARYGRAVPKAKFYEHASIGAAIKAAFVSDVRQITWAYKLAESTINLPNSAEVPEIQIFEIDAKSDGVAEHVFTAIDKAVRTPIIFEARRYAGLRQEIQMVAAHKQLGSGVPKLGPYFRTEWCSHDATRVALPTAIDLTGLYTSLLQPLTPVESPAGERVSEVVARLTGVQKLEREIASLERKLRNEPQLNRKVELRRALLAKKTELAKLANFTASPDARNMK